MSREAFEAWISENDEHPRACMKDPDGRYAFPSVRNTYFIWQAARAAALEEAAEVCERIGPAMAESYGPGAECITTSDECADAIRALKEK